MHELELGEYCRKKGLYREQIEVWRNVCLPLYGHLKRYAYGSKDWAYPNIPLISAKMEKSRSAVLRYLDILEHYGFAYKFGVMNESRQNAEESPIFKRLSNIPRNQRNNC